MFRLLSTCRLILWMRLWNRKWYWSRGAPRKPKFWSWRANLLKQITCFLSCKNQNCGANLVYKVVISEPLNFPTGYLTWVLSNIDNTNFYMTHYVAICVFVNFCYIFRFIYRTSTNTLRKGGTILYFCGGRKNKWVNLEEKIVSLGPPFLVCPVKEG